MKRQYTATVYILQDDKVLLIYHKKYGKWLPPGGHLDENELPPHGAIREAKEETGLDIALIPQENVWVETRVNGGSFERPYLCLLENIPARPNEPAHQHIDFIYLGLPIGGKEEENFIETNGLRWFTLSEIEALKADEEIFGDTIQIIRQILTQGAILPSSPFRSASFRR